MEEIKIFKNLYLWLIVIVVGLSIGGYLLNRASEAAHVKDAVIVYEEYQEIYNTCSKLNTDLCNMKSLPENDVMFEQFSKVQRVNTIKTQLNKWVEDYNAKSKMWGRSLWKSSSLPYELNVNDFNCYNN
jgi:hypothetical protein